jgi:ABC-type sugar transport system ATPase subunit
MNERSIISIRGVSKYFGDVHAVDNVDLEIERGPPGRGPNRN